MLILALDTSTEVGSCALWQEGRLLQADCPAGRSHSETLIPLVQQLLAQAGSSFRALDGVAFGMGPGAFTGLRVACGVAQGMGAALDIPLLPVGSLEAMAWAAGAEQVHALLDARMGEVYAAACRRTPQGIVLETDIQLLTPQDLPLPLAPEVLVVGNALAAYPELAQRLQAWRQHPASVPGAASVAALGALALGRGEGVDAAAAAPRYVRNKVARTTAERLAQGGRL